MATKIPTRSVDSNDVLGGGIPQGTTVPIQSVADAIAGVGPALETVYGQEAEIETVSNSTDFADESHAYERFMNEYLTVYLTMPARDSHQDPYVTIIVNNQQQYIPKGIDVSNVRRKYVEVLARMKDTNYEQVRDNPMDPASMVMKPITTFVHPFTVKHDPSGERGFAWLRKIMNENA